MAADRAAERAWCDSASAVRVAAARAWRAAQLAALRWGLAEFQQDVVGSGDEVGRRRRGTRDASPAVAREVLSALTDVSLL